MPTRAQAQPLSEFPANIRLLRRKDVEAATGLPTSSLYELMGENKFPKPIQVSPNRVAWIESQVQDWIRQRITASLEASEQPVRLRRRRPRTEQTDQTRSADR